MFISRLIILFITIFFLLTAPSWGYKNNGGGGTEVGTGSGDGDGGIVKYFDLGNTEFAARAGLGGGGGGFGGGSASNNLAYPGVRLNAWRQQSANNNPESSKEWLWRKATNEVMVESCGSPVNSRSPRNNCPLWWNIARSGLESQDSTWLHVHAVMPNPKNELDGGIAGQIAGYNIRVWREDINDRRWELIMQRQVGAAGRDTEPFRRTNDAQKMTRYWWYGGNTDRANGENKPNDRVLGGSYSMPGGGGRTVIGAGMVGNGQGKSARQRCLRNLSSGYSINYDGRPADRAALRKKINRGTTCYWEGKQMGERPFDYGRSGVRQIWGNIPRKDVPRDQFGPRSKKCFLGASCGGRRESFTFSWQIPTRAQNGKEQKTSWNFYLNGAPGLYYAVQIIAIDSRERIVPMKRPKKYVWTTREEDSSVNSSGQFMQVYISAPVLRPPPSDRYSSDENDYAATLEGDSMLQAREVGEYTVRLDSASASEEANNDSPNFPREIGFNHFTPQLQHSSPSVANRAAGRPGGPPASASGSGQLYSREHVKYYDLEGGVQGKHLTSVPDDWPQPPAVPGEPGTKPKMIALKQAVALNPSQPTINDYAWTTRISWLRGTLNNPCRPGAIAFPYNSATTWPTRPDRCQPSGGTGSNTFNAWDDLLTAEASWDAQRVMRLIDPGRKADARGMVSNQLLRCNVGDESLRPVLAETKPGYYNLLTNPGQRVDSESSQSPGTEGRGYSGESQYGEDGATDRYKECKNTIYPLSDQANSRPQKAQGIIDIQPAGNDQAGPAYITLDSNRLVSGVGGQGGVDRFVIRLYARDGQNPAVRAPYSGSRSMASSNIGQLELNFCRQGVPRRVERNNGDYAQVRYRSGNGIQDVPASFAGDSNCRGYVQWFDQKTGRFGPYGSEQWGKCWTNLPGRSSQARLNFLRDRRGAYFGNMDNNSANVSYGRSGLNGDRGGPRVRAYGNSFPIGRSPFVFKAPWEINGQQWQNNENSFKDCSRPERDRWIEGRWVRDKWVPGYWTYKVVNGKQVRDQWIKGYWTYKWQPGYWTYKNVRGYSMSGQWRIHGNASGQRGWGADNSGPPLKKGAYLVDIPFGPNTPGGFVAAGGPVGGPATGTELGSSCPKLWGTTLRPNTCWTLKASYEGYTNYIRTSVNRRTSEPDEIFVQVYGNRGIR